MIILMSILGIILCLGAIALAGIYVVWACQGIKECVRNIVHRNDDVTDDSDDSEDAE